MVQILRYPYPDQSGVWQTPNYKHDGAEFDRRASITVTTTQTVGGGAVTDLLDGTFADTFWFTNGVSVVGKEIKFDFVTQRIINEAKWYQSGASTHGTWKWQGSNNDSDWDDIGVGFTLGGNQTQTQLNGNTTAYRYYRLLGVSGTASYTDYIREIQFSIGNYDPLTDGWQVFSYGYDGGFGDRTASVTVTSSMAWTDGISKIIDGSYSGVAYFTSIAAVSGQTIKFDFVTQRKINEASWQQSYTPTATHGTWKWQGSNNDSDWTDIGSGFVLGGAATQIQTELSGNTTAYRYYQLLGVSGNSSNAPYITEIEFRIANEAP